MFVRIGWKTLPEKNTLSYYKLLKKKSFITLTTGVGIFSISVAWMFQLRKVYRFFAATTFPQPDILPNTQGILPEGDISTVDLLAPCTNQFRPVAFHTEACIFLFYKTTYLRKEVNCTEPFPSARVPCLYSPKGWPCYVPPLLLS